MKDRFFFLLLVSLIFPACANEGADNADTATAAETEMEAGVEEKPRKVIFFGDSLTAAYGLDPGEGFPAIIQSKLDDAGYNYKVVNAGLSGETSAGGNERVDWVLQQSVDIFVLELGGNDGLRGFDPEVTYNNLQAIIDKVKAKAPEARIILAGMEAPPNMGQEYTQAFRGVYGRLAETNDLSLIPFLLDDVGGIPDLNLPDGIHPNREGQKIVAENVWEVLQPLLEEVG
ncbi:arylesterase [Flavilitoribacter nigricans]|uniref:Arylesterase n=1 Tax=Flavilitoribacter nigricans (strain ATCC 23147 / DSM 23189 / NBRC 102662 / NCIMB 1420 / SS-2) TaxID=1122177 RepID=A0A2D0N312_FLAN2|nr:arylesterase [Flavilitoribacter nigricans]PHN02788.1 arylesterase [Flavilitoribacter nigricans DSM 23189 = NBRC 102662]